MSGGRTPPSQRRSLAGGRRLASYSNATENIKRATSTSPIRRAIHLPRRGVRSHPEGLAASRDVHDMMYLARTHVGWCFTLCGPRWYSRRGNESGMERVTHCLRHAQPTTQQEHHAAHLFPRGLLPPALCEGPQLRKLTAPTTPSLGRRAARP